MLEILEQIKQDVSKLDRRAVLALVYTAFGLTSIYYLKNQESVAAFLTGTRFEDFGQWIADSRDNNLPALGWWVGVVTIFYFLLPLLIIKFVWKANVSDFGLKFVIETGFWKLLAACTALMLPLVYVMSLTSGFAAKYPFLQIYNGEPI
jgi:hypothetical protein